MQSLNCPLTPSKSRKRKTSTDENMEGKENLNMKIVVHNERAAPSVYLEDYQRATVSELVRQRERHLEELSNKETAAKRGKLAAQVLRVRQAKEVEEIQKPIRIKQGVLENEKERANFVASLPPPAKNPVDVILEKFQAVKCYNTKHIVTTTKYIPEVDLVERPSPTFSDSNAKLAAISAEEVEHEDRIKKVKQYEENVEKANERFNRALQKEQLKNGFGDILTELDKAERATKTKKKKQLFRPLENRQVGRVSPTSLCGELMTPERERELEKAVERILTDGNEMPLFVSTSNVTVRKKQRRETYEDQIPLYDDGNSSVASLDELADPENDASLRKVLGDLRSEREATMKQVRSSPSIPPSKDNSLGNFHKDYVPLGKHVELESTVLSGLGDNRKDVFNDGFNGTEFIVNLPESEKLLVTVSTQTIEPVVTGASPNSSLSSNSLLSELARLSPLALLFDNNKNTQTDLVERYQKLLLLRAVQSAGHSSEESSSVQIKSDSSRVILKEKTKVKPSPEKQSYEDMEQKSPIFQECLKKVVEHHLNTQSSKDKGKVAKRKFFKPLHCEQSLGHPVLPELKVIKEKLPSQSPLTDAPVIEREEFQPLIETPTQENPKLKTDNKKGPSKLSSKKRSEAKEHLKSSGHGDKMLIQESASKSIDKTVIQEVAQSKADLEFEMNEEIPKAEIKSKENWKLNTSSLLLTASNSSTSTISSSPNESNSHGRHSSSSTSSASNTSQLSEPRIPNYIQYKVLNENRLQGFPHGPIETIEELRDLLSRLVPSGEPLDSWIRPRPPVSYPTWINDSLVPHELSTILEVETSQTSMVATDQNVDTPIRREFFVPEVKLQLFPEYRDKNELYGGIPSIGASPLSQMDERSQPVFSKSPLQGSDNLSMQSTKWSDLLKKTATSMENTPPTGSSISTISSLSHGLVEAFTPTRIASQSTPIKHTPEKSRTPGENTDDNLDHFNMTLIGHEISINEDDKLNPLLTTPIAPRNQQTHKSKLLNLETQSSKPTTSPFTTPSSIFQPLTPSSPNPSVLFGSAPGGSLWNSPRIVNSPLQRSMNSQRDSIMSESMVSFLRHEKSAMLSGDVQDS